MVRGFHDVFCKNLSEGDARDGDHAKPVCGGVFGASVANAAQKTIPWWYVVSSQDQALNPELERFYAKCIDAKTTEIKSSHVSFLSHP